jgi:3-hydroxyisobutyrate dehydrogenase
LMKKVGFVGLGSMGVPMASRLVQSGYQLVAYNRTRVKAEPLRGRAEITSTQREVAEKADPIVLMLTDTQAVEDVLFSSQGMYERMASGKTIINCSTILPSASRRIAERLKRKNVGYIEAPVFGGPQMASKGELIVMAAGEREKYEEVLDVIRSFAAKVFYTGRVGTAMSVKLGLNLVAAVTGQALAESVLLAQKTGVDPSLFIQILNSTGYKTTLSEQKGLSMVKGDFHPTFFLKHMFKDLNLMDETAKENKIFMPLMSQTRISYLAATNMGLENEDFTAIFRMLSEMNKQG